MTRWSLLFLLTLISCQRDVDPTRNRSSTKLFPQLQIDQVSYIQLDLPVTRINMELKNSVWYLTEPEYPADPLFVSILLKTLANAEAGQVVDQLNEAQRYRLQQPRIVRLRDKKHKLLASLVVGKHGPNYRSAFVTLPGSQEIRLVFADLIPALSRPTWGDRTIWRLDQDLIQTIRIEGMPQPFHAEKVNGNWRLLQPANHQLSPTFTQELLPRLAWFRAGDLILAPPQDLGKPQGIIHIYTANAHLQLPFSQNEHWLVASQPATPVTFLLSKDWFKRVQESSQANP